LKVILRQITGPNRFRYMLGTLVVLVILDGIITNLLLRGGLAGEGNPFLQTLAGGGKFLLIKTAGALLCALILWDIHRHWRKVAVVASACFITVYTGIVIWNLSIFFTA
jgi:hypothetical protein